MAVKQWTGVATVVSTLALTVSMALPAAAAVTPVTELDLGYSWSIETRGEGVSSFVTTDAPPYGAGALQLSTGDANEDKVRITTGYEVALSDITTLNYSTKLLKQGSSYAGTLPSYQLIVDADGDGPKDAVTIVFEPYYTSTSDVVSQVGVWRSWDAAAGTWWTATSDPNDLPAGMISQPGGSFAGNVAFGEIQRLNPDGVVLGLAANLGTYNPGVIALVDGLTINDQVYDFEHGTFEKFDCKNDGWATNFTSGRFVNQGDCVSYFASGGRTHGERL